MLKSLATTNHSVQTPYLYKKHPLCLVDKHSALVLSAGEFRAVVILIQKCYIHIRNCSVVGWFCLSCFNLYVLIDKHMTSQHVIRLVYKTTLWTWGHTLYPGDVNMLPETGSSLWSPCPEPWSSSLWLSHQGRRWKEQILEGPAVFPQILPGEDSWDGGIKQILFYLVDA